MAISNFIDSILSRKEKRFYVKKQCKPLLVDLKNTIDGLLIEKKNLKGEIQDLNKELLRLEDLKKFAEDYLREDVIQELARKNAKLEKDNNSLNSRKKKLSDQINKLSFQKALLEDEIEELDIKKSNTRLIESFSCISLEYIDNLTNGLEFEKCFASILKGIGFSNIEVTSGSKDFGIDVLAKKDDLFFGFQCKLYSSPVGNEAIQQAYSGKQHYNCNVVIVVTNNYFTQQAQEQARELQVILWDRDNLEKKIKGIKK